MNENKNITHQNLWDAAKSLLRGNFLAVYVYIRIEERSQINNLNLYLRKLEKEGQTNQKEAGGRK